LIDPRHARFFLSGQMGVWRRWRDGLTADQAEAVDLLLRYRPRRLAKESSFQVSLETRLRQDLLPRYRLRADGLLSVVGGVPVADVLSDALGELADVAQQRWPVPPVADGGQHYTSAVYLDGAQGQQEFRRNTYWVPDLVVDQPPLRVEERPAAGALILSREELLTTAKGIDAAGRHGFSLHDRLEFFLNGLRVPGGGPVNGLDLRGGPLNLLVAPTGTGKSILMRVAASHLARAGHVVVLVVPGVEGTLDLVEEIQGDLHALGAELPVVGLLSPRRLVEVARRRVDEAPHAHARARWTWERLGYSCLLPIEEGPAWQPGQEPCTDLRRPGEEGRHQCPLIVHCEKWAPWRQAAGPARIIVTNHAYFQAGSVPIPTDTGEGLRGRVSAQEFLLRRADVVVVDEIDAFQAHAVDRSGRTLDLARRDGDELLLERLNKQRQSQASAGAVPKELELDFHRVLKRLDYLPERYLAAVVNGFVNPDDPIRRRQPRLHLPRRWDNLLACRLCRLDEQQDRPEDAQLDAFEALFHQREPDKPPPAGWDALRRQVRLVVSQDPAADRIEQRRDELIEALSALHDGAGVNEPQQTAELLLRRAFLNEMQRDLAALEQLLPLMRDAGMRLADDVEIALDRGSSWQATPEGPIGRSVFGFAVTGDVANPADRTLTAEIITGDPHAYTAELGMTTASALTGSPRIVLGLSATAYLPGSPTFHVHADTRWYFPDRGDQGTGRLTIRNAAVTGLDGRGVVFSGADRRKKPQLMVEIGLRLWNQILEGHLQNLHDHPDPARRERARVLLVTNSYEQGLELCRGLIKGGARRSRLCLAVPAPADRTLVSDLDLELPEDVHRLPANRLKDFPTIAGADVLISPFARVARGLNIVVAHRSALDSIWVCVRPIRLIDSPSALVAHTGAHARLGRSASDDPAEELAVRHQLAADHLERINRANPAFSRLPKDVRTAVFADVFADIIQLAGRARRGGTNTTLYLVDNAFHSEGAAPGSDFPSLFRNLHAQWAELGARSMVQEIFGTTMDEFVRFARPSPGAGSRSADPGIPLHPRNRGKRPVLHAHARARRGVGGVDQAAHDGGQEPALRRRCPGASVRAW
jgi:hypothetical protein